MGWDGSSRNFDDYIQPNVILCNIVGIWPLGENPTAAMLAFAYFRVSLALTAVCSIFVPEILQIAMNWGDLRILTGVGCVSTTVGQLLFKMIYLLTRRKRMVGLYNVIKDLWHVPRHDPDKRYLEEVAYMGKIFTIGFFFSCFSNVVSFSTAAAVVWFKRKFGTNYTHLDLHLPFEVWYGPEDMTSPTFEIAFACQAVAAFICSVGIGGLDASLMSAILHVCGQFRLIQAWFRDIGTTIDRKPPRDEKAFHRLKTDMNKCVCHHQRMLEIVEEVDALLNPVIFIQILTSGLEICLSGYALASIDTISADLLRFMTYLVSMVVQLVVWCWPGEILIYESEHVANTVYFEIPWYELPIIYQKDVCYLIIRAQKHCRVTALRFQTMSINTLTAVFNSAGSYFTLLRNFQEDLNI